MSAATRSAAEPERTDRLRRFVADIDQTIRDVRRSVFALRQRPNATPSLLSDVVRQADAGRVRVTVTADAGARRVELLVAGDGRGGTGVFWAVPLGLTVGDVQSTGAQAVRPAGDHLGVRGGRP